AGQSLYGQAGNDTLVAGGGDYQRLDGEAGNDTLVAGGGNQQQLFGGNDADSLLGGNGAGQSLYGEAGNDTLVAGGGNDQLLDGGNDADSLHGDSQANLLDGGLGSDTLDGGLGHDTIIGGRGDGADWAIYASATGAVTVDLAAGTSSGAEGNDSLSGIENVIGGNFDDSLLGSINSRQRFYGEAGNDTLVANAELGMRPEVELVAAGLAKIKGRARRMG
ncbi:MAG: calcium-binding protein, partial [Alphaproteobacteria bacterium]|nr:calcium-binding protein [Alphaproteobacteria bacterium]